MAVDWIKMRTDLYRDPRVCLMADLMMEPDGDLGRHINQNCQCDVTVTRSVMRNVTRNAVVGALLSVWGVVRRRGKRMENDLTIAKCGLAVVDDIADLPGFGSAMEQAGWVVRSESGLVFPSFFEEYNSDPAEEHRAKAAERARRFREKRRNVTHNVTRNEKVTVDKSRVEKSKEKKNPPSPFQPQDLIGEVEGELKSAWDEYCAHRREIRKPLTPTAAKAAIRQLDEWGTARAIAALRHTVANGWMGIREPEQHHTQSGKPKPDLDAIEARAKAISERRKLGYA